MPIDAWERSALQEKVAPILITLSAVRKLFTATNPRNCATPKNSSYLSESTETPNTIACDWPLRALRAQVTRD